ncbi:MAG: hypothetical protein JXR03_00535 [Cyclobacteriaceae bacterium]
MGLFSKIKNFITGGAAEVTIVFEEQVVDGGKPLRLFVSALAKDDCQVKEVYFKVRGVENYVEQVSYHTTDSDGNSTTSYRDETRSEIHHKEEKIIAEGVSLKAGEEDKWLVTVEFPENPKATFHGKEVSFKWEVYAGLDMPGNDPDSGWCEFFVSKRMNYTINQI